PTRRSSDLFAEDALRFMRGLGVVGTHPGSCFPQLRQQGPTGGRAHVVGIGLERQTPYREGLATHAFVLATIVMALDQLEQMALLRLVDLLDRIEQARTVAVLLRGVG